MQTQEQRDALVYAEVAEALGRAAPCDLCQRPIAVDGCQHGIHVGGRVVISRDVLQEQQARWRLVNKLRVIVLNEDGLDDVGVLAEVKHALERGEDA